MSSVSTGRASRLLGGKGAAGTRWPQTEVLALAALTMIAFALRIPGVDQSLTLDEPHTYVMARSGLGDLLRELRAGYEIHPPLYFVLAWAAAKVGDPTVWVRVPSLVLGTATVPLTYLLGRRTVGANASLIGTVLLALSPFGVRFATDARPYATLMFFVVLSTLTLLAAVDSRSLRWWAAYAVSACAVLYSHYFGVFVILPQAAWALWACRGERRIPLLAYGAVGLGFLPWLPSFLDQPHRTSDFAGPVALTLKWLGEQTIVLFPGDGLHTAGRIPGTVAMIAIGVAVALLVVVGLSRFWRRRARGPSTSPSARGIALLVATALATPLGLLLFSVGGDNVWLARYLGSALPAIVLLVGALVASVPRTLAAAACAVVLAVLLVGTVKSYEPRYARADYKGAARFIESNLGPRDVILEFLLSSDRPRARVVSPIDLNFDRPHHTIVGPVSGAERHFREPPAGGSVFVAGTDATGFLQLPRPAPEDGLCAIRHRTFSENTGVYQYAQAVRLGAGGGAVATPILTRRSGRELVLLPSGARLPIHRAGTRGYLDAVRVKDRGATMVGWALDSTDRPAGCLLVFRAGGRFLGLGVPNVLRPDVAKRYGSSALGSGFNLGLRRYRGRPSGIRVLAVADGRANELERAAPSS